MKNPFYACLLAATLLTACSSKKDDPTPPITPPTEPYAFKALASAFVVTPKTGTAYTLSKLELSVHPYTNTTDYIFRGQTPSGTGLVVTFMVPTVFTQPAQQSAAVFVQATNAAYTTITATDNAATGTLYYPANGSYSASAYTGATSSGKIQ